MTKTIPELMLIVIPILGIMIFVAISWYHTPRHCFEDMSATADLVLNNFQKCADECWKKHDFGNDLVIDDCYTVNVLLEDRPISNEEFGKLGKKETIRTYWSTDRLNKEMDYRVSVRYNYTGREISLVMIRGCGNWILEVGEECDTTIDDCTDSEYPFRSCTGNRYCSDRCECEGDLNCDLCVNEIPTTANPDIHTDWCEFCSLRQESEKCPDRNNCPECMDARDNDCDGKIDDSDEDCR